MITSSRKMPVHHVTSRGLLYAPKNSTRSRCSPAATTMKLAPKKCRPRSTWPKVSWVLMYRTLSYA